jgi:hypothetical protein
MTDRTTSDLAALLTPVPSSGVQFSQGKVLTWSNETLSNTIEWRGITLTDVPIVEGINALVIRPGDIVGMLGWAPENAKGVGSWWILGKLSNPGEFVADLDVTAKVFRFVTEDGHTLAFFGKEGDGDPVWALYYGGADEQSALRILNANDLLMSYRDGRNLFRTSGAPGAQLFQLRDQADNELFSSNGATGGVGMADPWIPLLIQPTTDAQQVGTTFLPATASASFVTIWRGYNPIYHPRVTYGIVVTATGTTEWQLRMNSGSGMVTLATGSSAATGTVDVPNFGTTFTPGSLVEIIVNARNTGGGTTHIGVDRLYARQS